MKNKIALVTGANRGIGLATAQELLKRGYTVILSARNEKQGKTAQTNLQQWGEVYFHPLDVTNDSSITKIKQYVENKFGKLDILINNAGINYDTWHSAESADLIEVQETLNTNLLGPWRMAQAFIPLMKKENYGRIVNVSSGAGTINGMGGGTPGYSISKTGLNVLTIKLANNISNYNILVNAVCPGWVRTEMGGSGAPRSPEEGAETIVWAAELQDRGLNGKFFRDKREISW